MGIPSGTMSLHKVVVLVAEKRELIIILMGTLSEGWLKLMSVVLILSGFVLVVVQSASKLSCL